MGSFLSFEKRDLSLLGELLAGFRKILFRRMIVDVREIEKIVSEFKDELPLSVIQVLYKTIVQELHVYCEY